MTTRAEHTAGTSSARTTTPHVWRPLIPEHGERIRCRDCGSEDRWAHVPTPRKAER